MDSGGETVELNGQAEGAEPAAERVGPGAGRGAAGGSVLSARQERRPSRFCNPPGVGVPLPASRFVLIQVG